MRKLRTDKKIICEGSVHKRMLIRSGSELKGILFELKSVIAPHAFEYIRAQMGIKNIEDLDTLASLPKSDIDYNKFDKN